MTFIFIEQQKQEEEEVTYAVVMCSLYKVELLFSLMMGLLLIVVLMDVGRVMYMVAHTR